MPANHCVPHTEEAKAKVWAARLGKPAPWKRRAIKLVDGVEFFQCGRCNEKKQAREFDYRTPEQHRAVDVWVVGFKVVGQ